MYSVQCKVYGVQCTVYSVQCTQLYQNGLLMKGLRKQIGKQEKEAHHMKFYFIELLLLTDPV